MTNKEIYPFDPEWYQMVQDVFNNGGTLWVVERTDTNQFLMKESALMGRPSMHDIPHILRKNKWVDQIPSASEIFMYSRENFYPTKELAEKFSPKTITEGGCECCGNGSKEVPFILTEHEFVSPPDDTQKIIEDLDKLDKEQKELRKSFKHPNDSNKRCSR